MTLDSNEVHMMTEAAEYVKLNNVISPLQPIGTGWVLTDPGARYL
jgi:hypothetical protein